MPQEEKDEYNKRVADTPLCATATIDLKKILQHLAKLVCTLGVLHLADIKFANLITNTDCI